FVEAVSDVWEVIAWHAIFHRMIKDNLGGSDELTKIKEYMKALGVPAHSSVDVAVKKSVSAFSGAAEITNGSVTDYLSNLAFGVVSYEGAQAAAIHILDSMNTRAVVLMDSMEQFVLERSAVAHAMSGLFKCIARLNSPGSKCEIRFCFPSE